MKREYINIRIEVRDKVRAKEIARSKGMSPSQWLRIVVKEAINSQELKQAQWIKVQ